MRPSVLHRAVAHTRAPRICWQGVDGRGWLDEDPTGSSRQTWRQTWRRRQRVRRRDPGRRVAAATPAPCAPPSSDCSVALVEKGKVGGTCLHDGCIPTKALLHAAEVADAARESEKFGVQATLDGIDMPGVNAYKDGVVGRLYKGLQG